LTADHVFTSVRVSQVGFESSAPIRPHSAPLGWFPGQQGEPFCRPLNPKSGQRTRQNSGSALKLPPRSGPHSASPPAFPKTSEHSNAIGPEQASPSFLKIAL